MGSGGKENGDEVWRFFFFKKRGGFRFWETPARDVVFIGFMI